MCSAITWAAVLQSVLTHTGTFAHSVRQGLYKNSEYINVQQACMVVHGSSCVSFLLQSFFFFLNQPHRLSIGSLLF